MPITISQFHIAKNGTVYEYKPDDIAQTAMNQEIIIL